MPTTPRNNLTKQNSGDLNWDALLNAALDILDAALLLGRTTVAGSATPDIWTSTRHSVDITGGPAITGFAAAPIAGDRRMLRASAALTITAGANMLIDGYASGQVLPVAAGDRVEVEAITTTQFQVRILPSTSDPMDAFVNFTAAVGSSALTGTLTAPFKLNFRNATLGTGTPVISSIGSNLTLTVPSTATLGTINGIAARLVWLVAYNGGTPVLCVTNLAGGLQLDETNLISPTTISAGATAANVIYSASAVGANSPYRVIGFTDVTEATAGTWATAPSTVQPAGGQALALSGLGYMAEQNVTGSRSAGTTYYNTTGRPKKLRITLTSTTAANASLTINGNTGLGSYGSTGSVGLYVEGVVGPGESYSATTNAGTPGISTWYER